jgi:hypothetical protein
MGNTKSERIAAAPGISPWLGAAAVAAAMLLAAACSDSNDVLTPPGGGGASGLTVSAADPPNGDGTIEHANIYHEPNQPGGLIRVVVSGDANSATIGHEVEIYWDPANNDEVTSVQHFWSPMAGGTGGATGCSTAGTACVQAAVTVNTTTKTITLTNLVLVDILGGTKTSTLNGSVQWP